MTWRGASPLSCLSTSAAVTEPTWEVVSLSERGDSAIDENGESVAKGSGRPLFLGSIDEGVTCMPEMVGTPGLLAGDDAAAMA